MTTTVTAASRMLEQQLEAPAAISVVDEKTIALEGGAGVLPSLLQSTPGAEYTQSACTTSSSTREASTGRLSRRVQVLLDGRNLAAPENKNQEWISVGFLRRSSKASSSCAGRRRLSTGQQASMASSR